MSESTTASGPTRADYCIIGIAECLRGDGEIMANFIGTSPMIGCRLARASFEPDLVITDGEAMLVRGLHPVGDPGEPEVESWNPYRRMFDIVWSGRRHVMMGASQIDQFGNQNIACIGDWQQPKAQLLGFRGAPGNTINHATSYWVPRHNAKTLIPSVDVVSGVGYARAGELGAGGRFHEIRRVVSNLGVFDFETPDHRMRVRSLHPGVELDEVVENTGFEVAVDDQMSITRDPSPEELSLIDQIDPKGLRFTEVARG